MSTIVSISIRAFSIKGKALQTRESIFCLQSIVIALKVHHNQNQHK